LFSPLEDKSHIFAPPCNILYILYQKAADGEGFNYLKICSFLVLLQSLLNLQLFGVIVTTYYGTHSNFTIGRAGAEMK
jgi:hypothetical protein